MEEEEEGGGGGGVLDKGGGGHNEAEGGQDQGGGWGDHEAEGGHVGESRGHQSSGVIEDQEILEQASEDDQNIHEERLFGFYLQISIISL